MEAFKLQQEQIFALQQEKEKMELLQKQMFLQQQ